MHLPHKIAFRDKRVYNWFFDTLLRSLIIYFFIEKSVQVQSIKYFIVNSIVLFIYYFTFESLFSKSPAKFITKTKVVTKDGSPLTYKHIFIRSLTRLIPFEWISFFFSSYPVGWHDKFSNTLVIDESIKGTKSKMFLTMLTITKFVKIILYIIIAIGVLLLLFFGGVIVYRAFILHNL